MWIRTQVRHLEAHPDEVWAVVSDITRLPQWHHHFAEVRRDGDHHGTFRPSGRGGGLHARTAGEFTVSVNHAGPRRSTMLRQPQPGRGEHAFVWFVEAEDGGTRLTQRIRVGGRLRPGFVAMAGRPSAEDFELDMARLAGLVGVRESDLDVVIAGGTGFLGRQLASDLVCRGHRVSLLTRSPDNELPFGQAVWDGRRVDDWADLLNPAADRRLAVVNLAGKLVDCPPTEANITALRESRVHATRALVEASRTREVQHWLQASTTAIWSDAGETAVTEGSPLPTGEDALPQMTGVAEAWEKAASGANTDHMVVLRTSIVLEQDCPAFDRLAMLARMGAGGTVGPGDQWFSWIHLEDWLAIARSALGLGPVQLPAGVVVAASPEPVRNAELMRLLRQRLAPGHLGVPTPAPLLRLGAKAIRTDPALALTGRHATSTVLADAGFEFEHPELGRALDAILG